MLGARALRYRWHVHVRARMVWRRLRAAGMLAQLLRPRHVCNGKPLILDRRGRDGRAASRALSV